MFFYFLLAILCCVALAQPPAGDQRGCFEADISIRNPDIIPGDPDYPISEHFGHMWYAVVNNYFYNTTTNVTEEFLEEAVMRIEIYIGNPVAYTEVMIRRMHNLVEGPTDNSFTYGFLKFGSPYTAGCCLHSTVDNNITDNYIDDSTIGGTFYVPRSDGWTEVTIESSGFVSYAVETQYCNVANLPATIDIFDAIFDTTDVSQSWQIVNVDCPLKCQVQANYIFVLDGSFSIAASEWNTLIDFLETFVDNVIIASDATHVGYVYFTGIGNSDPDMFCVTKPSGAGVSGNYRSTYSGSAPTQFENEYFQNLWSSAIIDDIWYSDINWLDWSNGTAGIGFSRTVCFTPAIDTDNGGVAWVALYLSDDATLVESFTSVELPIRPYALNTGTGTGIALALELFDRPSVERPAVPDVMVVITDGEANRGQTSQISVCDANPYDPTNLRGISNLARLSGIEVYSVGVGTNANSFLTSLNYMATGCRNTTDQCFPGYTFGDGNYGSVSGNDDPHVFISTVYDLNALQPFLNQLLDVECIDASAAGTLCSSECGDNFCTACGGCIQCTVHNECPNYPCQYCSADLLCQLTSTTRLCSDSIDESPTACESYSCNRDQVPPENLNETLCSNKTEDSEGVSYEDRCRERDIALACSLDLDDIKVANAKDVCDKQGKTFVLRDFKDDVLCTCQSESDHDTDSAALIAGTTAGGLFLLCLGCLLPCLLLMCLAVIAIIVILIVLLVLIIIFLLVLLFGIKLAIPPKIHGIAVDDPTNVIAQENPLAQESGWQDAPQLE